MNAIPIFVRNTFMMTVTEKCADYSIHQAHLSACRSYSSPRGQIYKSDGHFATVFACYDSKHSDLDLFTLLVILPAILVAIIFLSGYFKSGR